MCNFTQCSTYAIQCSAILHTQCSTHTKQCSAILYTQCSTHAIQCSAILHTQCSTHAILINVFHLLLRYELMHIASFSMSTAIQKMKQLNDCLVNIASYIFLPTFQYKCGELFMTLKTLNHVYVKRNTTLMI